MKKKLLFVISQFYKGGAEVALLNILKHLDKEEYDIDLLILDQIVLKHVPCLIQQLPSHINVFNASEKEGRLAILKKICYKVFLLITTRQKYRKSAMLFVQDKEYDYAFSYGEWMSPQFVAKEVKAKQKAIWIHTDIDKASYVNKDVLFGYDQYYTQYIFVSENSKETAVASFPLIKEKAIVIHNMCDDNVILQESKAANELPKYDVPVVVTVANVRKEKNYFRQIEVMKKVVDSGTDFIWINIGGLHKKYLTKKVKEKIADNQLNNRFLLLGPRENPYSYMKDADLVAVLSDYESWSMVITEAKILNVPVIATKTSGALEQIEDEYNGILTDFDIDDISEKLVSILNNNTVRCNMKNHLNGFSSSKNALDEFHNMLRSS